MESRVVKSLSIKERNTFIKNEIRKQYNYDKIKYLTYNILKKGWDCLSKQYWCECCVSFEYDDFEHEKNMLLQFSNFSEYFSFLGGKIYENACYFQHVFTPQLIDQFSIDLRKINTTSFINYTIDDIETPVVHDMDYYSKVENKKKTIIKWLNTFVGCNSADELNKVLRKSEKQLCNDDIAICLNLLFIAKGKESIPLLCGLSDYQFYVRNNLLMAVLLYGNDAVKVHIPKTKSYKRILQEANDILMETQVNFKTGFDQNNNFFYCSNIYLDDFGKIKFIYYYYFQTFEELIRFTNGNLYNADFFYYPFEIEFDKYHYDSIEKYSGEEITRKIIKKGEPNHFTVTIYYFDSNKIITKVEECFKHFCDFCYFLKYDFTNADFSLIENFDNFEINHECKFDNILLESNSAKQLNLSIQQINVDKTKIQSYEYNHEKTIINIIEKKSKNEGDDNYPIYYVSDLHLLHKINNENCLTLSDVMKLFRSICYDLLLSINSDDDYYLYKKTFVFAGDTCSDINYFKLFVKILYDVFPKNSNIIFVLGNHELWCREKDIQTIISEYDSFLSKYGMYLLHKNMLLIKNNCIKSISIEQLTNDHHLRKLTLDSEIIIWGGTGFAGQNNIFNANNNIYYETINRETEISESMWFEHTYNYLAKVLCHKKVIIATHMPIEDWHSKPFFVSNFVYLHGHTHKNRCIINNEISLYADNQIGYDNINVVLKKFMINPEYDYFALYPNGIYEITAYEYRKFYQGKRIKIDFFRDINTLYMLKRNGIYCFIHKNNSGSLSILNGGAFKKLYRQDITYYYNNMDYMVEKIQKPMAEYTKIQNNISQFVKNFGGYGFIHGCIIDIDFYNHIYVNPYDLTITPYYAINIVEKYVYPSINILLKEQCPLLYKNFINLLRGNNNKVDACVSEIKNRNAKAYYKTDIYRASRIISKMQKLENNILCIWEETNNTSTCLSEKNGIR